MKSSLFKAGVLAIALVTSLGVQSKAEGDIELKKNYTKEFSTESNSILEISNRYGKVEVKTWDRSAVKIDVVVIVKANSKSKADDKLSEIKIKLEKNGSSIIGVTDLNDSNTSWWKGWFSFGDDISFEINYNVFMPATLPSIIENKYGNIYLPDLKSKTSINLKYGNLEAGNIDNDLLMDLSYGKATAGNVKNFSGTISYSDYRCTSAGVVILTSKYSKVYLDNVTTLTSSSKYDTYKIGKAGSFTLTGGYDDIQITSVSSANLQVKYTGVDISSLSSTLTSDISYGSLKIENLKTTFKSININTTYAPIKIYGSVPSKVDVSGKYFSADLGSDFITKNKEVQGNSKDIKGFKMSENTSSTISITSKYGDVIIR